MEFVFSTSGEREILKTKGSEFLNWTGFHQTEQEWSTQTTIDNFRISEKIKEEIDSEGNHYEWYEIDHHYRITDKTGSAVEIINHHFEEVENAMCEQDAATDERLSEIEDAICELDEAMNKEEVA